PTLLYRHQRSGSAGSGNRRNRRSGTLDQAGDSDSDLLFTGPHELTAGQATEGSRSRSGESQLEYERSLSRLHLYHAYVPGSSFYDSQCAGSWLGNLLGRDRRHGRERRGSHRSRDGLARRKAGFDPAKHAASRRRYATRELRSTDSATLPKSALSLPLSSPAHRNP